MNIDLSGKRVLVTGAGRGIGRAIAQTVHACGGHVIALSRTKATLDTLAAELAGITTVVCDVSDWDATRQAVEQLGDVHCLVNNAGVSFVEPFLEARPEAFDAIFNVNVKAVMNISQVVAKNMIARGKGGCIVNISSQAGIRPLHGHAVYGASKSALDLMTRVMALELGKHNIRVNNVNPTVIMTEMSKPNWTAKEKSGPMLAAIPLGRFGEEEDVAKAVAFLLSDHASMINSVMLPVDGGFCNA